MKKQDKTSIEEYWVKDLENILTEWERGSRPLSVAALRIIARKKELVDFIKSILERREREIKEEIKGMSKHHYSKFYECPLCHTYGEEGEFCPKDRRKLVKRTEKWEDDRDESYNRALQDVINLLKKNQIKIPRFSFKEILREK